MLSEFINSAKNVDTPANRPEHFDKSEKLRKQRLGAIGSLIEYLATMKGLAQIPYTSLPQELRDVFSILSLESGDFKKMIYPWRLLRKSEGKNYIYVFERTVTYEEKLAIIRDQLRACITPKEVLPKAEIMRRIRSCQTYTELHESNYSELFQAMIDTGFLLVTTKNQALNRKFYQLNPNYIGNDLHNSPTHSPSPAHETSDFETSYPPSSSYYSDYGDDLISDYDW